MAESNSAESVETPKQPKGFSLLTLILIFTVAGIGLSHVQTTYQLQKLDKEHQQLEVAHSKISAHEVSERLVNALAELNIHRIGDLAGLNEDDLIRSQSMGETSMAELQTLLNKLGVELQDNQ